MLEIYGYLLKIFLILCILLIIGFVSDFFHIENRKQKFIFIFLFISLSHKMIFQFSFMYITYVLTLLIWIIYACYDCYQLVLKKSFFQILFIILIFITSIFFPSIGTLRTYYIYKPCFLIRSYYLLNKNKDLPFLYPITYDSVELKNNSVYYRLGSAGNLLQHGGLVINFDSTIKKEDWFKYNIYKKIDSNCYFWIKDI